MAAYIVSFSIVVMLLKANEKVKENQQWALECVAIALLCLLAGLRSINVGTDTGLYLQPCIRAASGTGTVTRECLEIRALAGPSYHHHK